MNAHTRESGSVRIAGTRDPIRVTTDVRFRFTGSNKTGQKAIIGTSYNYLRFGFVHMKLLAKKYDGRRPTGPKFEKGTNEEKIEVEGEDEELLEVKASLADLLLLLLASPKHGVLFHDSEFACEKSANPLVTEVPNVNVSLRFF